MSEFSHEVRLDTLGEGARTFALEATADQRAALAARFGLLALDRLTAAAEVRREADAVLAEGRMQASVTQACVATGEPVPAEIDEPFALRFVPAASLAGEGEIELDAAELDTIGYEGSAIDLGEAIAETLGLALDPFPRCANADAVLAEAGVLKPEDVGPFAALKGLRDKLKG